MEGRPRPQRAPVECCPVCRACGGRSISAVRPPTIGLLRCDECGLVRADATFATQFLDEDYYGDRAEDQLRDAEYRRSRKRQRIALYDRLAAGSIAHPPPGARVLDLGCGTGALLDALAELGWATEGIERAPRAAAIAGRKHIIHAVDVEAPDVDLGERYSLVTCTHVLEHMRAAVECLRFLRRHLAPGGTLVVEVPNFRDWARPLWGLRYRPLELGDHVSFFDRATLREAMRRAGLDVRRIWAAPQATSLIMPSALTALDLVKQLARKRRGARTINSVATARASGRSTPWRLRTALLGAADRLDPLVERVAGADASWGADLIAIATSK